MDGYTKTLFAEVWDPYQLSVMALGGNQKFYEFMANYDKEKQAIMEKYNSKPAKWYAKKLAYEAKGIEFNEIPPAKNTAEELERAKVKTKEITDAAGQGLAKAGTGIKAGWNKWVMGKQE